MSEAPESSAFLRGMDAAFNVFTRICLILAGTALVVMTLMFAWLVYGRYVANDTPTWVEQVSHLLLMAIAFLGASVGVRQDTHLSVVYFRRIQVPEGLRSLPMTICGALIFLFSIGHLTRLLLGKDKRKDSIE